MKTNYKFKNEQTNEAARGNYFEIINKSIVAASRAK